MESGFIKGIIPAIITPMTPDEKLDEPGLKRLVDFTIEAGVHGIFVAGTAGEFWALSVEEKQLLYRWAVEYAAGRVPVYAGTCANTTREAVELSQFAQEVGADCLSVLTPNYITPTQDELFDHFGAIAESVDLPILLYDLPSRTGNAMQIDLVIRLAERYKNIVGIKDSTGDFSQSLEYLRLLPPDFRVVMGKDTLICAGFEQGAAAAIAASANVAPALSVGIYNSFLNGDHDGAVQFQERLAPVRLAFSMGSHPAMLKAGADMVGAAGGPPRKPIRPLSDADCKRLKGILEDIGILEK